MDEMSYDPRAFGQEFESSGTGSLHGRQGVYTRRQSLQGPPPSSSSSSSSAVILDPGSGFRSHMDLFPASEPRRLSVVKEESQTDDITAVTSQTSQLYENPYRTMAPVICLSGDESSSDDLP